MTDTDAAGDQIAAVTQAIPAEVRAANTVASQANAVTAIYGLSGAGKSGLADTAAEYAAETFGVTTLVYAADLGGWGNKRLALLRAGIVRIWDPRNHVNPFATMEMISLGAWPEEIIDPERGYARPDVKLVLPRSIRLTALCSNGHVAGVLADGAAVATLNVVCPTCGTQVTAATASKIQKSIVKPALFKGVGLRVYDSLTAMNEWALMQELPRMAAENELPRNSSGGSLLGAATALESGDFRFGSGSQAQVGFVQNRSYVWLANIRSIPDQTVPSIVIFGVEKSKADDESGGETILGPKIAGNARTSSVPGWVGNCLHASKEPQSDAPSAPMVYRLWLTPHIDPRDPRKIPYLAKHRGTPDGMPDFLEDPPADPAKAWSVFNMGTFFKLLQAQLEREEARVRAQFAGKTVQQPGGEDEIVGEAADAPAAPQAVRGPIAGPKPIAGAIARPVAGAVPAARVVSAPPPPVLPAPSTAAEIPAVAAAATIPPTSGQPPKVARPIARVAGRPPVS